MKRLEQIIKLVSEYEKIDVNTLSEKLNVSKVTIRKDLDKLESKGLLHREHGYAVLMYVCQLIMKLREKLFRKQ